MINKFQHQYRWLSNFYPSTTILDGIIYPSVENAYQAAKTDNLELRLIFADSATSPGEAKKIGKKIPLRTNWEEIKLDIMYQLVKAKFSQPRYKERLLFTKDHELVEGNWWGDIFWGVCNGIGQNHLGKILMRVREEFKNNE